MSSTTGDCAICTKPTTQRCAGCVDGLDHDGNLVPPAFYCSKLCQTKGFVDHKDPCSSASARKQLYRGCQLVQEVFYAYREATFDLSITDVRYNVEDDVMVIHEPYRKDGEGPLFPFPDHLIGGPATKKALLAWKCCGEAIASMHDMIKDVFKGITSLTTLPWENHVSIFKTCKRFDIARGQDWVIDQETLDHWIVVVTLKNGEWYAVDLAGAQFGLLRAVVPFSKYLSSYCDDVKTKFQFGFYKKYLDGVEANSQDQHFGVHGDRRDYAARRYMLQAMEAGMRSWNEKTSKTLSDILCEKQATFEESKSAILQCMEEKFRTCRGLWKAQAMIPEDIKSGSLAIDGKSGPDTCDGRKQSIERAENDGRQKLERKLNSAPVDNTRFLIERLRERRLQKS